MARGSLEETLSGSVKQEIENLIKHLGKALLAGLEGVNFSSEPLSDPTAPETICKSASSKLHPPLRPYPLLGPNLTRRLHPPRTSFQSSSSMDLRVRVRIEIERRMVRQEFLKPARISARRLLDGLGDGRKSHSEESSRFFGQQERIRDLF